MDPDGPRRSSRLRQGEPDRPGPQAAALHGGEGVLLGWQTDADTWSDRLTEAVHQPWVLQRRIQPVPEAFPTDDGSENWLLTWGPIMVHDGLGGYYVINLTMGATATCCFYQD
ncbi:hypothetical protein ABZS29_21045 [Kribbella sp. NPDC005582]|uniref:hypothetical protein n=1 Tax=Kribbella sp. NPDC005582 TaxID=3156893 RepID=UPI0033AA228B